MGFNTVAVLYNDFNFARMPDLGDRIQDAIRSWTWPGTDRTSVSFGGGMVVSQAHADYSQVVVVGQNRGRPIVDCDDLDHYATGQIADALRRHGWTVKPPAKKKRATSAQRRGES